MSNRSYRAAALGLLIALGATGCKGGKQGRRSSPQVAVPKAVLSWVGLRSPDRTVDGLLGLVGRFVKLPVGRAEVIDLLLQKSRLPRDLIAAIDTGRSAWLVGLSEERLGEPHPSVVVMPIRSEAALIKALERHVTLAGREGELRHYRPKKGAVGVSEVRLAIHGRYALIVSSSKAYAAARAFVLGNLIGRAKLTHDVELHIWVKHLAGNKQIKQRVERIVQRARQRMRTLGRPPEMIAATERSLRGLIEIFAGADELTVAADVGADGLRLGLRATGGAGSGLSQLVARQQAGQPYGHQLLPANAWLVIADHGNRAAGKKRGLLATAFLSALGRAKQRGGDEGSETTLRARLLGLLEQLTEELPGDFTVAAHGAPGGAGLTLSAVARLTSGERAQATIKRVAAAIASWARTRASTSKLRLPAEQQPLTLEGREVGRSYLVALQLDERQGVAARERMRQLLGERIAFGWAVVGDRLLLSIGKAADKQLTRMLAATKAKSQRQGGLASNPAFTALARRKDRVGLVYLSAVDLARQLAAAGVQELQAFGSDLKGVAVKAAPILSWGVGAGGKELDLTLELPARHFEHFKPFFTALSKRRGRPSLPRLPPP